jgi:tetratricopeptide (TPR) repeat protein
MTESEAFAFIQERLKVLRFTALINDPRIFDPLVMMTGGNPKAIEMALGLVKHQRQPLQQVIDDLCTARGELFDDLFTQAWSLLDTMAQRILLAMPLFASSASEAAMSAITHVRGFAFSAAVERLTDLALLDVRHPMDLQAEIRYVLHPLVRAFMTTKLHAVPHLEAELREQWVVWYTHLVGQVGYCWNDQSRLKLLDPEHETIQTVIEWCTGQKRWSEALKIVRGIGYYYYVRGMWEQNPPMYLGGFETTYTQADAVEEAEALAYHIQMLCKQGKPHLAERYIPRLQELVRTVQLPEAAFFEFQHAIALFAIAQQDIDHAEAVWQQTLELAQKLDVRAYIANRRWLATCLYRKGLDQEAEQLLSEALRDAVEHHYVHGIVSIQTKLAHIYLDRNDVDRAHAVLHDAQRAAVHAHEHRHVAALQQCIARLHTMRGDLPAAREALSEALNLFERLGMRRELEEATAELARLGSGATSSR